MYPPAERLNTRLSVCFPERVCSANDDAAPAVGGDTNEEAPPPRREGGGAGEEDGDDIPAVGSNDGDDTKPNASSFVGNDNEEGQIGSEEVSPTVAVDDGDQPTAEDHNVNQPQQSKHKRARGKEAVDSVRASKNPRTANP